MTGLDIGGITLSQGSSKLTINPGVAMSMATGGTISRPGQTMFIAQGNPGIGWTWFTTEQIWNKITFTGTPFVNVGGCFDAVTNSRFTAPYTGSYWFTGSTFLFKDNVSDGYYFHPVFYVNGAGNTRTPN